MKKFLTRRLLIIFLVIDIILCGIFMLTSSNKQRKSADQQISESSIQRICELATLDCFYHNVLEWNKPGNFIGYGGKRLWIEYDGIVRVGIKADQIKVSDPDKDGIITVMIPDAIILDKDLDEDSMFEIDSAQPLWGFIPLYKAVSTEERIEALAEAQEDMMASASQNGMILDEAKERAKRIIEKNIIALGDASGKHYQVKFVNTSEVQTISPTNEPQE